MNKTDILAASAVAAANAAISEADFRLDSYDYFLPQSAIATHAHEPADEARLLVYERASNRIQHLKFIDLPEVLPSDCAMIFNDTKVFKARIFGRKSSGGAIELFINKILPNDEFIAQIRGRVKEGARLFFDADLSAVVLKSFANGSKLVKFLLNERFASTQEVLALLDTIGHVPLPPYIKRADTAADELHYQSIFARHIGAVAAPTASLHFTKRLIAALAPRRCELLTLHVGAGTFASVEAVDIREHAMHSEYYAVPAAAAELINSPAKLCCVGTTVTRTVEFFARTQRVAGECDLFLHPGNLPKRTDYLITNFHLPKSTLIMLVAAFIGRQRTLALYELAREKGYKFYSYGDGMLII